MAGTQHQQGTCTPSAFVVANDVAPKASDLVHHWAFEDGSKYRYRRRFHVANMTLTGMDNSNWRTCPDGSCLWYDGTNDMAKVNVDDWYGNMTVSQWV